MNYIRNICRKSLFADKEGATVAKVNGVDRQQGKRICTICVNDVSQAVCRIPGNQMEPDSWKLSLIH